MKKLIIGIDFSKKTLNFCILGASVDDVLGEGVLPNSRGGWSKLLRTARKAGRAAGCDGLLFCGEDTGLYSQPAAEWLTASGCGVWLGNALAMSREMETWREKTDASDARRIARYAFRNSDRAVGYVPMTAAVKRLKLLDKEHRALTDTKVRLRNIIGQMSWLGAGGMDGLEAVIAEVEVRLRETDRKITALLKSDPELAETAALAVSVPGISYLTAAVIIDTRNFTRFTDGRKYAAHTGCVPYRHESGTSIRRRPHVSKYSNRRINSMLTQGAVSIMTRNRPMMEYAARKRAEGKNTGFIINNIRSKIVKRLFAVIRGRTPFRDDYRSPLEQSRKCDGNSKKNTGNSQYLTRAGLHMS